MYGLLITAGLGLLVGVLWVLSGWWGGPYLGLVLAMLVMLGGQVLISRWLAKQIQPRFQQAQKQLQSQQAALALKTLQGLLPYARWQLLLKSQIEAQIGTIYYGMGEEAKALENLRRAHPRIADAQLILAGMHFRAGRHDQAKKALEGAIRFNRKNAFLYNTYAYMLLEQGDRNGAIRQLQRLLKVDKSNAPTQENLERVQNGKKMNMKPFGLTWYGLKIEKVPGSMRVQPSFPHPGTHSRRFRG